MALRGSAVISSTGLRYVGATRVLLSSALRRPSCLEGFTLTVWRPGGIEHNKHEPWTVWMKSKTCLMPPERCHLLCRISTCQCTARLLLVQSGHHFIPISRDKTVLTKITAMMSPCSRTSMLRCDKWRHTNKTNRLQMGSCKSERGR